MINVINVINVINAEGRLQGCLAADRVTDDGCISG